MASQPLEPRGKEQEERRGEDSRGVEKGRKRERLFWAGSQQPDSDQSASRLVPSVQWSRARGGCPVIGTALSIRKTGPEHRDTAEYRSPVSVWILLFILKPSQIQKLAIIRKQNPLT